jgi:hypothetical protein
MNFRHLVLASLLAASACAHATPVTWTFQNLTFTGGGVATGSFVHDADTGAFSDVSVTTLGGNSFGLTYDSADPYGALSVEITRLADGPDLKNDPVLYITFDMPLTGAGGWVGVVMPWSYEAECVLSGCGAHSISPGHWVSAGGLFGVPGVAPGTVPEPHSVVLLLAGLLGLVAARRPDRRQMCVGV